VTDPPPLTDQEKLALLRRFEPVIRFTEGELFLPASAEEYVGACELWERRPAGGPVPLAVSGELDLDGLAGMGRAHSGPGLYLRLVSRPFSRREVFTWRRRPDRPRFHGGSRLAQVGVLSRAVDALNRLSLIFRGKVAAGTQAAAEAAYRDHPPGLHPYYGRVLASGGYLVVQYWFLYYFNDWRSRVFGVNDHEADWEQVTIYLAPEETGPPQPAWVVFSAHDAVGDDLRRRWDDPDLELVGESPVVHAGLGSHSGAYLPGDYLVTFDPSGVAGVLRLARKLARVFLPWTRGEQSQGVGIPYVDYHRGDGQSIGPGQPRQWTPVLVDDHTPWIRDYRGLWGNDTADPFGGERGPAGPRYERSTLVRSSWGNPVGWAGLDKVPPSPAHADALLEARVQQLDQEAEGLRATLTRQQASLRADTVAGTPVSVADEAAALATGTRLTEVDDERMTLAVSRSVTRPPAGPHDHLRHRELPIAGSSKVRRRVLAVWSALSTPLLLTAGAVLFLPFGVSVLAVVVVGAFVLAALEAVARRQLVPFVLTSIAVVAALVLLLAVVTGLAPGWRYLVAGGLLVSAGGFLFVNLVELRRT
jgi:hypothetical protein